jgi:dCTP diphosphatase
LCNSDRQREFAKVRDWDQFHTPRNLALALVGEVGELCEIFQWKGEVEPGLPGFSAREIEHVGEEMSDVLLYLTRMADRCGIDLGEAVVSKLEKNARKYPSEQVRAWQHPRAWLACVACSGAVMTCDASCFRSVAPARNTPSTSRTRTMPPRSDALARSVDNTTTPRFMTVI